MDGSRRSSSQTARGWNREKDRCTNDFHHQAPAGQPGFGVGHRRHDGRGSRARRDPGGGQAPPTFVNGDDTQRSPHAQIDGTRHRRRSTRPATTSPSTYEPGTQAPSPARHLRRVRTTASSPTAQRQRDRQQGPRHRRRARSTARSTAVPSSTINGASGTISGNQVYDFQKNGIRSAARPPMAARLSTVKTSATVQKNIVTGEGHIDYIAQNGILISYGASATVKKNTVSGFYYTGPDRSPWPAVYWNGSAASTSRTTSSPATRRTSTPNGTSRRPRQALASARSERPGSPHGGPGLLASNDKRSVVTFRPTMRYPTMRVQRWLAVLVLAVAACSGPAAPSLVPATFEEFATDACDAFEAMFRAVGNPDAGNRLRAEQGAR